MREQLSAAVPDTEHHAPAARLITIIMMKPDFRLKKKRRFTFSQ